MPQPDQIPETLRTVDIFLNVIGTLVCGSLAYFWYRVRGGRMDWGPDRSNRLDWTSVAVVVVVFWACAWIGGAATGMFDVQSQSPEDVRAVRLALTNAAALIGGAVACAVIGLKKFQAGWRGYGLVTGFTRKDLIITGATLLALWPLVMGSLFWSEILVRATLGDAAIHDHSAITLLENEALPTWTHWLVILTAAALAPITEEMFFRGILQTRFFDVLHSRRGAVLAAALCFAIMHGDQPAAVLPIAVLGILLGVLYEMTGSLLAPILVHTLFNAKSLLWHHWITAA